MDGRVLPPLHFSLADVAHRGVGVWDGRPAGPHVVNRPTFTNMVHVVTSFDHLVGAAEQRQGHGQAERFSGLEVDDQFEFGGLLHG